MYTETEIVDRSGHSYESIEAYVKEFARVVMLAESGLNAVTIRQVTGRSMTLVNAYLDLYRKYDGNPDYVFRLEHIKKSVRPLRVSSTAKYIFARASIINRKIEKPNRHAAIYNLLFYYLLAWLLFDK